MYRPCYRFLETVGGHFDYLQHAVRQNRWSIYDIFLSGDMLRKLYRVNALTLLQLVPYFYRGQLMTRVIRLLCLVAHHQAVAAGHRPYWPMGQTRYI